MTTKMWFVATILFVLGLFSKSRHWVLGQVKRAIVTKDSLGQEQWSALRNGALNIDSRLAKYCDDQWVKAVEWEFYNLK